MRKLVLPSIVIVSAIIILIKLFYLQIIDDELKIKADNNAIKIEYDFPERGYIYDRNGKLLVANQPSYDIMVIPREIKNLDTLEFCNLLKIDKSYFDKKVAKAIVYSPRLPSVFLAQLTKSEFAAFQEKIRKFKGFFIQKRYLRDYQTKNAANVFGYIAQVNDGIIKNNSYYKSGDLIGKQGVEQEYENTLRGIKGVKYYQKDRFNRIIGSYKDGKYDTIPIQGKDLTLTLDGDLQKYGEELMINKRGGIVAIEPKTGEILALISAPTYDPALLVGKDRSKNYTKLYYDSIAKPLYDRALLAEYPPGSPFKILTGLIGLQEEVIDENTGFLCRHGFSYGRGAFMKCHDSGISVLHNGIYRSCNTYFANVFKKTIDKYKNPSYSVDNWRRHVTSFGLGEYLGTDMPTGKKGRIPSSKLYNHFYPNGGWRSNTIISNSIGQGEIDVTPIQLANMMAAVANEGYYYTPHIVKKIKNFEIDKRFTTRHQTTVDKQHFKPVIEGLYDVYNIGTASSLKVLDLAICGKTGTAENFMKIDGKRVQLTDHSIFVAFAPKDNPKIAIAVLVENGYWGNRYAGPIATLMIEKYLKGEVSRIDLEKRMLNSTLEPEYAKPLSGKPFSINR
jgi:penicillin-binding protein 2